ncbi:hypothetical protein [uncultured Enterovirga sp.]|uniref:hypothetical protein n=1 Tax=uncultured Enterovirga sp. TaxID=2026352 RepID=UPI0035CC84B9
MTEDDTTEPKRTDAALPRDVQEHLGRRLRTALRIEDEKPAFLGETNVPPQFEPLVRKLEASERGERQGYEAVKRAIIDTPVTPRRARLPE